MTNIMEEIEQIICSGKFTWELPATMQVRHINFLLEFPTASSEEKMDLLHEYLDDSGESDVLAHLYRLTASIDAAGAYTKFCGRYKEDLKEFIAIILDMPITTSRKLNILNLSLVQNAPLDVVESELQSAAKESVLRSQTR